MSQSTNLTYQNNYENNFNNNFENNFSTMSQNEPDLQRFTATGRPMPGAEKIKQGAGMNAMAVSDSMGTATPNLLPFRYTDDSMLTIPVQPPPPYPESMLGGGSDDDGPIKEGKSKKRFSLSSMRRSSKSKKQPEFVMKEMTRGEYLKHYAKNEQGQYIGTEEPAADILFSDPSDYLKFRAHPQGYEHTPIPAEPDTKEKHQTEDEKSKEKLKKKKKWAFNEAMATGNAQMFV